MWGSNQPVSISASVSRAAVTGKPDRVDREAARDRPRVSAESNRPHRQGRGIEPGQGTVERVVVERRAVAVQRSSMRAISVEMSSRVFLARNGSPGRSTRTHTVRGRRNKLLPGARPQATTGDRVWSLRSGLLIDGSRKTATESASLGLPVEVSMSRRKVMGYGGKVMDYGGKVMDYKGMRTSRPARRLVRYRLVRSVRVSRPGAWWRIHERW